MTAHQPPLSDGILDSRGRQTPLALIIEWGGGSMRVVCPYCLRYHYHGPSRYPLTGETRTADCHLTHLIWPNYQLCYPFEDQLGRNTRTELTRRGAVS
jgi:hypothetical protein